MLCCTFSHRRLGTIFLLATAVALASDSFAWSQFGGLAAPSPKLAPAATPPAATPPIEPPPGPTWRPSAAQARILTALERPLKIQFQDMPLEKLPDWLAQKLGVPVLVEERALEAASNGPRTLLSVDLPEQRASVAMRKVLRSQGLVAEIRGEILELVDAGNESLTSRVYDVADLIAGAGPNGKPYADSAPLTDLLRNVRGLPKPGWVDDGGIGTIVDGPAGTIVISQTPGVHAEIVWALQALRRVQSNLRKSPPEAVLPAVDLDADSDKSVSLRTALETVVSIDFQNLPIADAIDRLAVKHKIDVDWEPPLGDDRKKELETTRQTPVTLKLERVTLRTAFDRLLEKVRFGYEVRRGRLLIAETEQLLCERALTTRIYPIRDLLHHLPDAAARVAGSLELGDMLQAAAGNPNPGWTDDGGVGSLSFCLQHDALVVSQGQRVHDQIDELLADLRRTIRPEGRTLLAPASRNDQTIALIVERDDKGSLKTSPEALAALLAKLLPEIDWKVDGGFLEPFADRVVVRHSAATVEKVRHLTATVLKGLVRTQPTFGVEGSS